MSPIDLNSEDPEKSEDVGLRWHAVGIAEDNDLIEILNEVIITERSDGRISAKCRVFNAQNAFESGKELNKTVDLFRLGRAVRILIKMCVEADGVLVVPKNGLPDDLRLAVSLAAAYPGGLRSVDIREKLGISDNSRRAYVNSPEKRTSEYVSYDSSTKTVAITPEGIRWILREVEKREQTGDEDSG